MAVLQLRLLIDVFCASALGFLLFTRVNEQRTLWLLRGYLFLVALAWFVKRISIEGKWISIGGDVTLLPLTSTFVDALVLACSLSLAILWQGELRRLMELLGTGRLAILLGNPQSKLRATASTVAQLTDAAGRLSKSRRGALMVVDLGSDLRPEDFLNPGVTVDAQLSSELLLNLFAYDTPLHDGAVVLKGNRIISAGVILPLSRQGISRYGTRHLAALGITERFDRCICVVVSEETGTLSLANQGKLERPITSSRLQDLLTELMAAPVSSTSAKTGSSRSVKNASQDSSL